MRRLIMFYEDKQGKKWELRNVRPHDSIPHFVQANVGADDAAVLHVCVTQVQLAIVDREREAKA